MGEVAACLVRPDFGRLDGGEFDRVGRGDGREVFGEVVEG